jgi:CheY-like chemotaxis protein
VADRLESQRILVVDDDRTTRQLLGSILDLEGYSVDQCAEGYAALQLLRRQPYAALLTDYMMPGMTGLELTQAARELQPGIGCFIITGLERPVLAGVESVIWLGKPIDVDAIIGAMRSELA